MNPPRFIHLRLHSEFSISDGIVRLDEEQTTVTPEGEKKSRHVCPPVEAAKRDGMPAVALTDLMNVFGAVRFYQAACAAGVQPIIGCDVRISNDRQPDAATHSFLACPEPPHAALQLSRA